MRTGARVSAALVAGMLLLGACGTGDEPPATTEAPSVPTDEPSGVASPPDPQHDPTSASPDDSQPPQVTAAIEDLAAHLSIDPGDIAVLSYEDVTWPDGSIGCPQPGMSYTQALVPGSRLVLEAQDAEYAYHAGREPDLERCADPRAPVDG